MVTAMCASVDLANLSVVSWDEVNRLKAMAISKIEVGTMLGVKAATR